MSDFDAAEKAAQAARRDFSCLVYTVHGAPPSSQSQALRDAECALEGCIRALRSAAFEAGLEAAAQIILARCYDHSLTNGVECAAAIRSLAAKESYEEK